MHDVFVIALEILYSSWEVLQEASVYIILGLLVSGLLKVFISPSSVASHLGQGRVLPVLKAALVGIPIPLCSCGVLPAAASLKKQGANNGATMAFLISTPESGVDSISISWALLDPLMTVTRPVAAFISAFAAGVAENFRVLPQVHDQSPSDLSCPVDNCCDGSDCLPQEHQNHHTMTQKLVQGIRYAAIELWGDIAGPFFIGVLLAGIIYVVIPEDFFTSYLGGGFGSMLIMLVLGIPLYICATASTPIAAAFILKGVSPGAALVFLLVGPATNIMSVSVLTRLLGKRATILYLVSIAIVSVLFGLGLDKVYELTGLSARATIGTATEIVPLWLKTGSAAVLVLLSAPLCISFLRRFFSRRKNDCGCTGSSCSAAADEQRKKGCPDVSSVGAAGHVDDGTPFARKNNCC
ncbi:MAG: SO_0444 family Cu/Zn efflux transporter [Desulfobulbaceae bacterium]|nr:SO_0444 family Cu/Zn efflux transporter [Desulfobulbaceae bacterium]